MKHLARLNKYFWKYKYRFIFGILCVVLSNIFGVLPPQIIRYAFDLVKQNVSYYNLYKGFDIQNQFYSIFSKGVLLFGALVLLLALLKGAFMFLMRQTLIVMSRFIEYDLSNEIYAHYQKLNIGFYKRNKVGDLMSRVSEDVGRVRMYLGPAILYGSNMISTTIIILATMLSVNAELTLYVLLPLPLLSLSIYYINTLTHAKSEAIQKQLSVLTSIAQESFSGIRILKAYNQQNNTLQSFNTEAEIYKERTLSLARTQAFWQPLMMLMIGISVVITIYIGGVQVIEGKITTGNIAEFVLYVGMLTWPITSVGWVASMIQRSAASQKRINEFWDTKPDIQEINNPFVTNNLQGNIAFKNVNFVYPDTGIEALKNVSFELKAGEKMAIIGKTGAGKSTIADLLVRHYDVQSGEITIDNVPIKNYELTSLRTQIGYVPQDTFLFSDTVRNNIAFGFPHATLEQVKHAAQNAAIRSEIEQLPLGFETIVGERGVTLSGGQKQRIAIARALIKNPNLVLLDDCLSAVDAQTEHIILNYFNTYLQHKTAIVITHRIFSLFNFNKILVIDDGRIAEQGTHNELLALRGLYYNLYEKQQQQNISTITN